MSEDAVRPDARDFPVRYEFIKELGRGRTAVVYLARVRDGGRHVAVKLLHARFSSDGEALRQFSREPGIATALEHPNIVELIGIEEIGDAAIAIITDYVQGETLRGVLRASGQLSLYRSTQILRDISAALAHAHARGIVHGDVRPENILIDAETGRALLADFGISRALSRAQLGATAGSSIATPTYMSPEQVDGGWPDERSDIYALALVGWEMLTGLRPWGGEPLQSVLHKQKHEYLPDLAELRPDTPAFLLSAINGGLAKEAGKRWQNASELLARLTPAPRLARPAVAPRDMALNETPTPANGSVSLDRAYAAAAPSFISEKEAPARSARDDSDLSFASNRQKRRWWAVAAPLSAGALLLLALQWSPSDSSKHPAPMSEEAIDSPLAESASDSAAGSLLKTRTPNVVSVATHAEKAPARTLSSTASVNTRPSKTLESRCRSTALADQRTCLLAHIERNDAELTRAYQALIAELRRTAGGAREPMSVQALRTEQRAWLAERDRVCRNRSLTSENPLWAEARVPCFAELSDLRATELRKRLGR